MIREVVPNIFEIDTKPLGHENLVASFLIKGSSKIALIDPGFPSSAATVIEGVVEAGIQPERIDYLIVTHTHIDHAGALGKLAQSAPDSRVVCHKRGAFYLKNSRKITGGARMVFGSELSDRFGESIDIPDSRIDGIEEDKVLDLGNKKLQFFFTPGHSGDHVSIFEQATGTLFSGDVACIHYPQLGQVPIPAGSPPIYRTDYIIEELQRLSRLDVKRILTPHYGESNAGPAAFFDANIQAVKNTQRKIEKLFSEGLEFQQVLEKLRADIIAESGNPRSEIPDFLADIWLRIMLKTGLMGYMADILQYARDIRPFYTNITEREA